MGFISVKGGKQAIKNADRLSKSYRKGKSPVRDNISGNERTYNPLDEVQIRNHLRFAVDRVMSEAGLYAPDLAALAIKQSEGDPIEASFLLRSYRSTLQRVGKALPVKTEDMRIVRRISSAFKDIPGGQYLGPTRDYSQRILDFGLLNGYEADEKGLDKTEDASANPADSKSENPPTFPKVADILVREGLFKQEANSETEPFDITRESMTFPAKRSARLQCLARGEEGGMQMLAYSSLRGYGAVHPTIGELRVGLCGVKIAHPYTGKEVSIGEVMLTECEAIIPKYLMKGDASSFRLGYGLVFGQNERKAISMSILDGTTSIEKPNPSAPSENQEFVLQHIDGIDSSGFVEHLKLPHYVTFQSDLDRLRKIQQEKEKAAPSTAKVKIAEGARR